MKHIFGGRTSTMWSFILLATILTNYGFQLALTMDIDGCNSALGMENGDISDQDVTSSSSFDQISVGPQNARIRSEKAGGAWCPSVQVKPGVQEWLQIDLRTPTVITAVETQGRFGGGHGLEYPTGYMIEYWRPGMDQWRRYKNRTSNEVIMGNQNTFTPVLRELDSPIIVTKIRFVPWSDYTRTVCMRVEIYGCLYADRLTSYSIPQGFKGDVDLRDKSYDGILNENSQQLTNGLGQLFDGRTGDDDYTVAPYEWIGWRKTDFSSVIELTFDFKDARNFSSMSFHCNNFYENDVRVFSKARLYFANQKDKFSNTFMEYSYTEDKTFDSARWVKVTIPYQTAQFVKLELEFSSKFILLSEIQFDSALAKGNLSSFQAENKLIVDATTVKSMIIPLAFDDLDKTTKYRTEKMTVFTFHEMPPEYVGLTVGISLAVAGICAIVVLIVVLRQRKCRSNSTVYSTASYAGFNAYPTNIRDIQMYLSRDGTSAVIAKAGRPSTSSSSYVVNFSRIENELLDKLPCSPPPKRPHPTSPPPDYRSECQTDESSEYADPDSPMKSSSEVPLIPPPPAVNKRRASLKLNLTNFAQKSICSIKDSQSDDSLHYASSDVASPEQAERNITASFLELFNRNQVDGPSEFIVQIPRNLLQVQEKLGEGEFGEVYLCVLQTDSVGSAKMVAVKSLTAKTANENAKQDFQKEIHVLSKLKDENIVQLLGVCTEDEPWFMVVEYMEQGDLNQYLQRHSANLMHSNLIFMASQIASGMKYLESLNLVHRDLATRNCLVGEDLTIKIADFGMARSLYSSDYYKIEGRFVLPIRWMAWECILLGKFTPKTDVWAFGVTLWEILTYAKCQPFAELNDSQVIDNIQHIYHNGILQTYLLQPSDVPNEIYDLMLECWNREDNLRPSFHDIHLFLQRKSST